MFTICGDDPIRLGGDKPPSIRGLVVENPRIFFVDFKKTSPALRDGKAMLIYVVKTEKSRSVDTMYIL